MCKPSNQIQPRMGAVMNDILEFIDDIEELKSLYNTGELRNFDFEAMLSKYNRTVELFEREYEMDDGA